MGSTMYEPPFTGNCTVVQEQLPEGVDELYIQIIFSILYIAVWSAAIVGNSLVLYVVIFGNVSLSVRSVFIGCLAVSDMLMSLTSLPVTAVSIFMREWIFPGFLCKLIGVFQGGSIFVSSFTLAAIAIDRCFLVRRPNKDIINYERAINIVIGIWILGYGLAMPIGIFSGAVRYPDTCGVFCEESWPDYDPETLQSVQRRFYGLLVMLLQFGFPTIISTVCYILIARVMNEQLKKRMGQSLLPESEQRLSKKRNRANRMMVCMVCGLVIAWMPLNAINLYRDLGLKESTDGEEEQSKWFSTLFAFSHVTAMLSAVVNPLIYSWFNPNFRSAVKQLFNGCTNKRGLARGESEVRPLRDDIRLAPQKRRRASSVQATEIHL